MFKTDSMVFVESNNNQGVIYSLVVKALSDVFQFLMFLFNFLSDVNRSKSSSKRDTTIGC